MIMRSMESLCTCVDGACPRCSGRGRVLCTPSSGHWGEHCPFCGGTGERECEWCYSTGKHALCGGTGVIHKATRGGIVAWPTLSPAATIQQEPKLST
jgi:hypothetical protein